ncbi:hypothetical protein MMU55_000491 [Campylobacter jejuni]|uniref:Uncharacterized protein n=1 Tax=Campylobacter jejuni TaxID=197 RepID=A0AB36FYM3_CAMJU|nr:MULTISPECIES: hypothetical protein [Campylobacter]EIY3537071.1 hypothetical protein [Campylobacter jejuni]EMA2808929.1 hypothetical protein [Campylobacter jejuni]OEV45295.1 hypothetical protein AJY60_09220 [Campylobacter jejuni]RTJ32835.1 hypothetical protein C3H81_02375 [Campylobacter jejuni]TEY08280.1 hypothetical protein ELQ12_03105 [Campylobacter sp. US25a]
MNKNKIIITVIASISAAVFGVYKYKNKKKIILRGIPGSGKTTLAYVLNKDIKKLKEGGIATNNTPKNLLLLNHNTYSSHVPNFMILQGLNI